MAKGIPATLPNVNAAFVEAGYEHVKVNIEIVSDSQAAARRVKFELPDGTHGSLTLEYGRLPENKNERRGWLKKQIVGARRARLG